MLERFRNLPPPYDGIVWLLVFLAALVGGVYAVRLALYAAERRRQAVRDRAAQERLTAIETALADMVERVGRLETRSGSGGTESRPAIPATNARVDRL